MSNKNSAPVVLTPAAVGEASRAQRDRLEMYLDLDVAAVISAASQFCLRLEEREEIDCASVTVRGR